MKITTLTGKLADRILGAALMVTVVIGSIATMGFALGPLV